MQENPELLPARIREMMIAGGGAPMQGLPEALRAFAATERFARKRDALAGSNAMRLFEPEVLESHRRWLVNALRGGRQLVVEPWLEREQDFSVQLEMTADGLKLCGYTGLLNDANGHAANITLDLTFGTDCVRRDRSGSRSQSVVVRDQLYAGPRYPFNSFRTFVV